MAKTPTKAAAKTPAKAANATPAAKAPATKPETAPNPPAPKPEEKPETEPTKPDNEGTGTDGHVNVNDVNTAQESVSVDNIEAGNNDPAPTVDIEAIRAEAYKEGYSAGFTDAIEPQTGTGNTEYASAGNYNRNRLAIVALAVKTPENHRKGGLTYLVDRLSGFFDQFDEDDQYAALVIANAIADRTPVDIANGRYELLVKDGLAALNGYDLSANQQGDAYDASAAAARLEETAMPEELEIEKDPNLPDDTDATDPDESASAAARMTGAI